MSTCVTGKISYDATEHTKLGPGFDVQYVSGAQPTTYYNDAKMEDTASSSVRFVGEAIPKSNNFPDIECFKHHKTI